MKDPAPGWKENLILGGEMMDKGDAKLEGLRSDSKTQGLDRKQHVQRCDVREKHWIGNERIGFLFSFFGVTGEKTIMSLGLMSLFAW